MQAFVYCWTDHQTNKLYIGVHKGTPDDGYVCSSRLMFEEYKDRPKDFTRQIIASGTWEDMYKFESKLLAALNAAADDGFYNKFNGFGQPLTEDAKKKIGQKSLERWMNLPDEVKKNWSIKSHQQLKGVAKSESHKSAMRGKRPHVNQSGSKNNNAKKINTPFGVFDSIKDCSESTGIVYDNVYYKLRAKHNNWSYVTW